MEELNLSNNFFLSTTHVEVCSNAKKSLISAYTVLDIKGVENAFFHSMYIFSVILHAIDKHDISK